MCRTLFKIGPVGIHTYGLMLALAFFAGLAYVRWRADKERLRFDQMLTIGYILIFSGIIGARLGFVLLHLSDFAGNPLSAINPFHSGQFGISGLNLYGGVVVALVAMFLYMRWRKLPVLAVFDFLAPTIGIGLALGRIGCFLNGCCFGTPTDAPWGVTFPEGSIPDAVFPAQAIHPAQLYSSAYGIILFFLLHNILKRKRFDGQVVAVYLMVEAVFRHTIEYVRYYESEMHLPFLGMDPTWNQIVSVLLFLIGLIIYRFSPRSKYRERKRAEPQPQ